LKDKIYQIQNKKIVTITPDLVIGCDGAFSAVRKEMMKKPRFNYSQEYIPHAYMELCMPPVNGDFAMPPNYLHIWPRGQFMMIGLPNQDKTFTVTLFMPTSTFESIKDRDGVLQFFNENFRDSINLIGKEKLVSDFFSNRALPLVSIKCSPYNIAGKAVIMGDAAHAMVPFYGQGMNCGMEDCLVLEDALDKHKGDLEKSLEEYSINRNPDAEAMCDLAMYNYIEMRDLVNKKSFLVRKKLDNFLHWLLPKVLGAFVHICYVHPNEISSLCVKQGLAGCGIEQNFNNGWYIQSSGCISARETQGLL